MNIDKLLKETQKCVERGFAKEITVEKVEKRLEEAKKAGNSQEIYFFEQMLNFHKKLEEKT